MRPVDDDFIPAPVGHERAGAAHRRCRAWREEPSTGPLTAYTFVSLKLYEAGTKICGLYFPLPFGQIGRVLSSQYVLVLLRSKMRKSPPPEGRRRLTLVQGSIPIQDTAHVLHS